MLLPSLAELFEHFDRLSDRITDGGLLRHLGGQRRGVAVETGIVSTMLSMASMVIGPILSRLWVALLINILIRLTKLTRRAHQ
jgi:hypothetical protein